MPIGAPPAHRYIVFEKERKVVCGYRAPVGGLDDNLKGFVFALPREEAGLGAGAWPVGLPNRFQARRHPDGGAGLRPRTSAKEQKRELGRVHSVAILAFGRRPE